MLEVDKIVDVLLATIGAYEADSVVVIFAITVAAWILLFGYYISTGSEKPRWMSGKSGQRTVLLWSWFWTASAVCVLFSGWGFLTWRLSNGLMLVPTAPEVVDGIIYGYVLLAAAVLLLAGWLPRALLPASEVPSEAPAEVIPPESDEDRLYQPLYPELSFGNTHQPATAAPQEQRPPPDPEVPAETKERPQSRRRLIFAAGVAVLVVAIAGGLGIFAVQSAPATGERFALADLAASVREIFTDPTADVIRDDALNFQITAKEARDSDFAVDIDRWRPLAKQGNTAAQYKLGVMYANGRGTSRDYIEAYKWLNIAGAVGNERAIEGRDAVARRMTPSQLETAQKLAGEEISIISDGETFSGEVPARLKEMTKRELVREAQRALNTRGFKVGLADGLFGPRTRAALRQYERQNGLPETGEITHEIVARLISNDQTNQRSTAMRRPKLVLAPSLPQISSARAPAKIRVAPSTECDALAAHPSNGHRFTGIVFARIDPARAIPACEQAIAKYPNELRFQFQLARSLHKAERHNEALALYSKAGERGFALAQRSIGFMYANANGVAQDIAKAATWLRQAADRCDVDAQFALGALYAKGQGVMKNDVESLRWYRIAAAQDHPDARAWLEGFANRSEIPVPADGQTNTRSSGASLNARFNFEPGDYTAARHFEKLLVGQERDVIDAYERRDFSTVVEMLRPVAEQGEAPAQTLLGYMYRAGLGVAQSDSEAVEWYRKAAEQDDPNAQYLLGYMHHRGLGVPQYFAQALQWYRKSARQGVAAARLNLGVMYDNAQGITRDRDEALAQYFSAAEAGLAGAQHSLAAAYENGDGVPRDFDEAVKWYRLAAAQDFALSQNRLGEMYSQGRGVPRDADEAMAWYRLAAEQGLPDAQFNLAKIFAAGRGVPRDRAEAVKLFTLAAEQGHVEGQVNVAFAHLKGRGVERSSSTAVAWFQRAASQCNADAQYQLASMYRLGLGVPNASAVEELKWLKLAAEQGQADALQELSVRYAEGKGVQQNQSKAFNSVQRAAELGQLKAQFDLAEIYANGSSGIAQDYTKAAAWYRKAALQGNREAQSNLARLYREGLGVALSYVDAVTWYRQAAQQGDPLAQHSLATAYRLGAGVERDNAEAVNWYRLAAGQGDMRAQRDLGLHYLRGEGVLQDFIQARLWLSRAAANGDTEAANALGRLARKMTPNQIAESERLAAVRPGEDG